MTNLMRGLPESPDEEESEFVEAPHAARVRESAATPPIILILFIVRDCLSLRGFFLPIGRKLCNAKRFGYGSLCALALGDCFRQQRGGRDGDGPVEVGLTFG